MKGARAHKQRKGFCCADNGSITVETVVMFPLILAALAFSFEFGRLFIAHHTTVNNVRAAVRYLSRSDLTADQLDAVETIVKTGKASGGAEPAWMADANVTITPSQSTFTDANYRTGGQIIRVQVTVPYQPLIFSFVNDDIASIPFTIAEDMRHIGD